MLATLRRGAVGPARPLAPGFQQATRSPKDWERTIRMVKLNLTEDIAVLATNAEVVSSRVKEVAARAPNAIPAGCLDEVIGYWPTDTMIEEGGYEGCLSQIYFPRLDWGAAGGADNLWRSLLDELYTPRIGPHTTH
ncbi:hypothetical protein NF557_16115 [Ornithinimicrobium cryptoxanthini]|uniref:Uncharacterized protein n=2 Tax=Ornithinimicrobium cryptoxanthini TaxID=2934161 RepID=A0ABY4YHV0_9MICO|nr:hypothetical protein [Ornithinimicrobium cryptoxanthini]USQ76095.1 hypothetical protein NF557_16115 [Ornithinimicrobium cryptoxanthini]